MKRDAMGFHAETTRELSGWIDEAERRIWFLLEAGGRGDSLPIN